MILKYEHQDQIGRIIYNVFDFFLRLSTKDEMLIYFLLFLVQAYAVNPFPHI